MPRQLELFVNVDGLRRVHAAIGRFGHIVQLAQCSVASARVVPGVTRLRCDRIARLDDRDGPLGLDLLNEGAEGGTHDAAANEDYVNRVFAHNLEVYLAKLCAC